MASAWSQLDQLLTCAICLDRYRNPKLLPCQHTFCMEPCLDGLIDYARRQIKCPECRAEHRIPYKGIQEFPTNVTLMRFLELHRDITGEEPEPPPSMMERCNVCSEKSNLERCAHCDKKICPDCKEAHVDILRREINRINNQVRRGLHRLSEALTQTKKNAEKLQINCNQVKDEIEDIVRRYSKDLRHTEEKLKHDLEIYTETELKSINKLKEDLDAEVSNMTSNCDLVDKYIKDDAEWSDVELLEYKEIFLKTLDFLRGFDPDNSDFARRIKFQPRADPDVLHRNIADFGELKINAPPSAVPTQQSLMPPQSNALMRSQSDHRLAAQFARRTDSRSLSDRYSGHASDNERESGRPTSPLFSRNRRDADSSGYRRYSERSRDSDYQDRSSNRYLREDNSSSSILSSRWRDNEDYGHRSRVNRDYEDYDSEPQHNSSRTVRFADDPPQRERLFDMGDATKGPLSGVVRLMDSPKIMERLHQNEVRQKQPDKETPSQESQPPPQPEPRVQAPTTPITPTRKVPSRQQSEDDIDKQKKANQQQASSSSNAQPTVTANPEAPLRPSIRKGISETSKPPPTPDRTQRTNSTESAPPEIVSSSERPETTPRTRKPLSNIEKVDEPDTTTSSSTTSQSRCARPSLGKTLSLDGGEPASAKPALDKKVQPQQQKYNVDRDEDSDSEEEDDEPEEPPRPVQSSFFSRQRRLPDPEPRLLQESDDEVSEDDDSNDEEEEENETTKDAPVKKSDEDIAESDSEESSSSTSSSTESESEDSDAFEDESLRIGITEEPLKTTRRSSEEAKPRDFPPTNSDATRNQTFGQESSNANQKNSKSTSYSDEEGNENIADLVDNINTESATVRRRSLAGSDSNANDSNRQRPRRRSDDADTTDSSSCSSSTNYLSLSCNTTPLSNGTPCTVDETISSEGSSTSSTSTNSYRREPRFSSAARRRPILARSKSSHELGIGYDAAEDMDEDEDVQDTNPTPSYRSRSDRMSEGNTSLPKTRSSYGTTNNLDNTSTDNPSGLSTSSNTTWAKYLKNKYGSNAAAKVVVPRSRSSHTLYKRSDSESSDDEGTSTKDSILPGSYGFSNPRSTYMQKRRMLLKIGARGTETANFTWPRGIAVGPENSIVVADSSNHRVQVFDAIGKFLHEFGTYGSGEGEFDCLAGVAVNRIGQYIVSDRYNHRIQLFDQTGRFLRTFGCEGRTDGRFNYPWGITTDSLGFIYVCDKENHRIQVFQSDGTFVGKFGSVGSRPGQLEHPHYIAVSNTNRVIVSDTNNHRVQIFDVNGRSLSTFGNEGSSEGQFKFPRGVAVDDQGFIIVGDSGNNRIQIFHPDGTFLRCFGTWGSAEGEFKGLEGIAVTSGGSIMVCDRENHRIQVF